MNPTFLERIASGDQTAVQGCIDTYGGLIWSLARRFSRSEADAEDAVQEIFIDLWKSAGRYKTEAASEKTFIAMIARRRLIDRHRYDQVRPEAQLTEEVAAMERAPDLDPGDNVDASLAAKVMAELKPEQQAVLRLSIHLGMSHGEIAEQTNIALGTVKSHIRRGLAFIRERMTEPTSSGRVAP